MNLSVDTQERPPDLRNILKGTLMMFLPIFALALALTAAILFSGDSAEKTVARSLERHRIAIQAAGIDSDMQRVLSDLWISAHHAEMVKLWSDDGLPVPEVRSALTEEFLNLLTYAELYDQVRLLDEHGMEIVRVDFNDGNPVVIAQENLQSKKGTLLFRRCFCSWPRRDIPLPSGS